MNINNNPNFNPLAKPNNLPNVNNQNNLNSHNPNHMNSNNLRNIIQNPPMNKVQYGGENLGAIQNNNQIVNHLQIINHPKPDEEEKSYENLFRWIFVYTQYLNKTILGESMIILDINSDDDQRKIKYD